MEITAEIVMNKVIEVSRRHQVEKPVLGIDSLVLILNTEPAVLMPVLIELHNEQKLVLYRREHRKGSRSKGLTEEHERVSLY